MEQKIQRSMKNLGCTYEEAVDIVKCDQAIERGEPVYFDLPKDKAKNVKQWTKSTAKKSKSTKVKNQDRAKILENLKRAVLAIGGNSPDIVTAERELYFEYKGKRYKITLSCPRT